MSHSFALSVGETPVFKRTWLRPASSRRLAVLDVKVLSTGPSTSRFLAIRSSEISALDSPFGPTTIVPLSVSSTTSRRITPGASCSSMKPTRPVDSTTCPVFVNEPPLTVMPFGLARIRLARVLPSTSILPSIRLRAVPVTWLTMVRALMPTLFSDAPAAETLNDV